MGDPLCCNCPGSRDMIASILNVAARHSQGGVVSNIVRMGRDMAKPSRFCKTYYADPLQSPKFRNRAAAVRYEGIILRPQLTIAALSTHLSVARRADSRRTSLTGASATAKWP